MTCMPDGTARTELIDKILLVMIKAIIIDDKFLLAIIEYSAEVFARSSYRTCGLLAKHDWKPLEIQPTCILDIEIRAEWFDYCRNYHDSFAIIFTTLRQYAINHSIQRLDYY